MHFGSTHISALLEHSADTCSKCIDTEELFLKTSSDQRDPNCQREAEIWTNQCNLFNNQKTSNQKYYLKTEHNICLDSKDLFIEAGSHYCIYQRGPDRQREAKNQCYHSSNT